MPKNILTKTTWNKLRVFSLILWRNIYLDMVLMAKSSWDARTKILFLKSASNDYSKQWLNSFKKRLDFGCSCSLPMKCSVIIWSNSPLSHVLPALAGFWLKSVICSVHGDKTGHVILQQPLFFYLWIKIYLILMMKCK